MAGRRTSVAGSVLLVGACIAALSGCGSSGQSRSRTVTVDAASSLTGAFTRLGRDFERAHPGVHIQLNFGGSDSLAAGIVAGAPVDVFAAASPTTMATVTAAADTVAAPVVFARNQLEIAVPPSNPGHITSLADTVRPGVTLVLCAASVPCGAIAAVVYKAAALTPHPVSLDPAVTAVLTSVELGQADAGLVYRTDIQAAAGKVRGIPIPATDQAITSYPIAVTKHGHARSVAGRFLQYVLSAPARSVLAADGFLPP